jgi:hypothetical protein
MIFKKRRQSLCQSMRFPKRKTIIISILVLLFANINCVVKEVEMKTRWKYYNESNKAEMRSRDATIKKIDKWWKQFKAKKDDLAAMSSGKSKRDLLRWVSKNLKKIDLRLFWEFGPAVKEKGRRLVITPESDRHLRPLVDLILERAPRLKGWEFYTHRLPESYETALNAVKGRTGGDVSNTYVRASINQLNLIDVTFLSEKYTSEDDNKDLSDVFVATEALLGEEVLNVWIGSINAEKLDGEKEKPVHIKEFKQLIDSLIIKIKKSLPDKPYHKLDLEQNWMLYELKPEEAKDYPGQLDMFVGTAMIPAVWLNAHNDFFFDSTRFSNFGETFCYIKMDGTKGLSGEKFEARGEIEDALDEALRDADVGCHIGGGTGLRYSYIDLVLTDLDEGTKIIKKILRDGNITKNTWILFFDSDLAAEWIEIWDDPPPPPMIIH